jgi:hypothetical protein
VRLFSQKKKKSQKQFLNEESLSHPGIILEYKHIKWYELNEEIRKC